MLKKQRRRGEDTVDKGRGKRATSEARIMREKKQEEEEGGGGGGERRGLRFEGASIV